MCDYNTTLDFKSTGQNVPSGSPVWLLVGQNVSHGCVRLSINVLGHVLRLRQLIKINVLEFGYRKFTVPKQKAENKGQ